MISVIRRSSTEIALEMAARAKKRRLALNLTQEGLVRRSRVPLGTLKKFARSGQISLRSFIRLAVALKDDSPLEGLLPEQELMPPDDFLQTDTPPNRARID